MLSSGLRRALLDQRHHLPPTFLLPWAASLSTVSVSSSTQSDPRAAPSLPFQSTTNATSTSVNKADRTEKTSWSGAYRIVSRATGSRKTGATTPKLPDSEASSSNAISSSLSPSVREMLPLMRAQAPHYITLHIQGNPYLVTEGDTIRLPYLMHDVEPGDVLRLNRAINLGSRDYTLKSPAPAPKLKSTNASSQSVLDSTTAGVADTSASMATGVLSTSGASLKAPHFIPHIAKGKYSYIDDRLFICRALVMGVESEPMRIKEKTKRRQRHVRKVKSKHRYTIIKIKELRIKSLEGLESEVE